MAKVLIFIVAYNAETTIEAVLRRIPPAVLALDYKILVIDDQSQDHTFEVAKQFRQLHTNFNLTVLVNPDNQGYGGNQKIGYQYAIQNGFDVVVLLHGDGQYAPELLMEMIRPITEGRADAVLGSRMLPPGEALKGGMPLYKFVGNRILTHFQNAVLRSKLSEFHSGYRAYSVPVLAALPFQYNTNDFHFDTEIIIQLLKRRLRIVEIQIPTYYGQEICHVNGLKYAWNVFRTTLTAKLNDLGLFYQRKFDVVEPGPRYPLKLGYLSSHTAALDEIPTGNRVLDIGCGEGLWAAELKKQKQCFVQGIDQAPAAYKHGALDCYLQCDLNSGELPANCADFDCLALLDVLEHLDTAAQLKILATIRERARPGKLKVLISVPNVAFIITRCMLLLGQFNYGQRGILDSSHRHLFTRSSLKALLRQAGYQVEKVRAIPPPYPAALGNNVFSRLLLRLHSWAAWLRPTLLAYQFLVVARPLATVPQLLQTAIKSSE